MNNSQTKELQVVQVDVKAAAEQVEKKTSMELALEAIVPPKNMPPAKVESVQAEAKKMSDNILNDPDDRTFLRDVTNIGEDITSKANRDFGILRTSLGRVMDRMSKGEKNSIPADLKSLRDIMDEINPYPAIEQLKRGQNAGWLSRMFSRVPGIGKVLSDIAKKYESVQTQVDAIIQSLNAGSDKLLENTMELEERYDNLKDMQSELKVKIFHLGLVLKSLEEAKESGKYEGYELQKLEKAIVRIVRRLQNLYVTENAFSQFFITMNITMDNHDNLRDAVSGMVNLTRPILENGLALKIAQQDEKQIAEALAASQDYLGNLMVSIAEESMDNAAEIAKVANEPLIKFQDLVKSYKILTTRMDEAHKIELDMVANAKKNMADLEQMTKDLEERAAAQENARDTMKELDNGGE